MTGMWTIEPSPVDHPDATAVMRDYLEDVAGRYYGRPATAEEVDRALAAEPADDLVPPSGVFLLGRAGGAVTGCVGVKLLDARTAELTKLYICPAARGSGGGSQLLLAAERAARELGAEVMCLNTRQDLTEAKSLYARHGYVETEPYTTGRYVDHCFQKALL
ncbi:hypothetical protein Atai01_25870 [Amycolatopsis taiwanensis]|uniref:N-acetyltransferase domain-containing protein n=2 Tax=Amycolatopsis taiwanensis TaxID=342230 RepID=A0A9W6R0A6_9PSEU|nr:hypothetical protein Atai01_25870 [Amycolatopsis taiwanensis]